MSAVISQVAAVSCIQPPVFDTRDAIQRSRNSGRRRGAHGEGSVAGSFPEVVDTDESTSGAPPSRHNRAVRVLIVEDDTAIAAFLAKGLVEAGFAVDQATTGDAGLQMAAGAPFDAAIVDVMLPGMDGLTLVETLRQRGIGTPVLILSARHTVDDRVRGLQAGGDDYLVKPFAFPELLARVQALVRRGSGTTEPRRLAAGEIEMDLLAREVYRKGQRIELRPKEWALLEVLMRSAGRVVSKTTILAKVYDYRFEPGTNVVDVLVHRLREKVDRGFDKKLLATVRGMGYVLKVD